MDTITHLRYYARMEEKAVAIQELVIDIGCQPRGTLDMEAVDEYAELLAADATFPPIHAVDVEGDVVVIDGFHRVAAAVKADQSFIRVVVVERGDLSRARWLASGANQGHGVRRTNADKRAAVLLALESDIGQEQSLRVVAEHVGVSHEFVRSVKEALSTADTQAPLTTLPPDAPGEVDPPEEESKEDMYVTAAKVLFKAYRKICKVLGNSDDVCEAAYVAYEKAKEREV